MSLAQSRRTGARSLTLFAACFLPLTLAAQAPANPAHATEADCNKLTSHSERNDCEAARLETRTIFLKGTISPNDANEIMVAVRNSFDPGMKIYLVNDQNALVVTSWPEELARVESLVRTLDLPRKTYRITYTLTELDAGKTISTQHYSMLLGDGEHTSLKEGNKIPIATGTYSNGAATPSSEIQTQFTYLDVGMNFDATVAVSGTTVHLKSKVEQSSLDQPVTIAGVTEPVVRQSVLDGVSTLSLDKPALLGTIDVPNSTRHIDIAVVVESLK